MVLKPTFDASSKEIGHYTSNPRMYSAYNDNVYVLMVQKHRGVIALSKSRRTTKFIGYELSKGYLNILRKGANIFEIDKDHC
ncbi:MAG: hypothetical protein ACRCR2_02565 [Fusobacteriaceae bacterium]